MGDELRTELDELRKQVLGLKTELGVLVKYLATVKTNGSPILGPDNWEDYHARLKAALAREGL